MDQIARTFPPHIQERAVVSARFALALVDCGWREHQHRGSVRQCEPESEPVHPIDAETEEAIARVQSLMDGIVGKSMPKLNLPFIPWPHDDAGRIRLQWASTDRPTERSTTSTAQMPSDRAAVLWKHVVKEIANEHADVGVVGRSAGRLFLGPKDRLIFWPKHLNSMLTQIPSTVGKIFDLFTCAAVAGVKIDVKAAYRAIGLAPEDAIYHAAILDGVWVVFNRLSFGMAQSPAAFVACMAVSVERFRGSLPATEAALAQYVDDSGMSATAPARAVRAAGELITALLRDGWWVSVAKTFALPAHRLVYTGFIADFNEPRSVRVAPSKARKAATWLARVTRPTDAAIDSAAPPPGAAAAAGTPRATPVAHPSTPSAPAATATAPHTSTSTSALAASATVPPTLRSPLAPAAAATAPPTSVSPPALAAAATAPPTSASFPALAAAATAPPTSVSPPALAAAATAPPTSVSPPALAAAATAPPTSASPLALVAAAPAPSTIASPPPAPAASASAQPTLTSLASPPTATTSSPLSRSWFRPDTHLPDGFLPSQDPAPAACDIARPPQVGNRLRLDDTEHFALQKALGYVSWFQVAIDFVAPWRAGLQELQNTGQWTRHTAAAFDDLHAILQVIPMWRRRVDPVPGPVLHVVCDASATGWGAYVRLMDSDEPLYFAGAFDAADAAESSTRREALAAVAAIKAAIAAGLRFSAVDVVVDSMALVGAAGGHVRSPRVADALVSLASWAAQGLRVSFTWWSRSEQGHQAPDALSSAAATPWAAPDVVAWPLSPAVRRSVWDRTGGWDIDVAAPSHELATALAYATPATVRPEATQRDLVVESIVARGRLGWRGTTATVQPRPGEVAFAHPPWSSLASLAARLGPEGSEFPFPLILVAPVEPSGWWGPHLARLRAAAWDVSSLPSMATIPPRPGTSKDPRPLAVYRLGPRPASGAGSHRAFPPTWTTLDARLTQPVAQRPSPSADTRPRHPPASTPTPPRDPASYRASFGTPADDDAAATGHPPGDGPRQPGRPDLDPADAFLGPAVTAGPPTVDASAPPAAAAPSPPLAATTAASPTLATATPPPPTTATLPPATATLPPAAPAPAPSPPAAAITSAAPAPRPPVTAPWHASASARGSVRLASVDPAAAFLGPAGAAAAAAAAQTPSAPPPAPAAPPPARPAAPRGTAAAVRAALGLTAPPAAGGGRPRRDADPAAAFLGTARSGTDRPRAAAATAASLAPATPDLCHVPCCGAGADDIRCPSCPGHCDGECGVAEHITACMRRVCGPKQRDYRMATQAALARAAGAPAPPASSLPLTYGPPLAFGQVLVAALRAHGGSPESAVASGAAAAVHAPAVQAAAGLSIRRAIMGSSAPVRLLELCLRFAEYRKVRGHPWSHEQLEHFMVDFTTHRIDSSLPIEGWAKVKAPAALCDASRLASALRRAGFATVPAHCGTRVRDLCLSRGARDVPEHTHAYPLHIALLARAEPPATDKRRTAWEALFVMSLFAMRTGIIFHVWSHMFIPYDNGYIFVWRHTHKRTFAIGDVCDLDALSRIGSITGARHPALHAIIRRAGPNHRLFPSVTSDDMNAFVRTVVPAAPPGFDVRNYGTRASADHDATVLWLSDALCNRIFWWKPKQKQMRTYYSAQVICESFVFSERRLQIQFTFIVPGTADARIPSAELRNWSAVGVGTELPPPPPVQAIRDALACTAPSVGVAHAVRADVRAKRARRAAGMESTSSTSNDAPITSGPCTRCAEHVPTDDEAAACVRCTRIVCRACWPDLAADWHCPAHQRQRRRAGGRK